MEKRLRRPRACTRRPALPRAEPRSVRAVRNGILTVVALAAAALAPAASAQDCTVPGPLPPARAPHALRFGIAPQLAGSAGAVQQPAVPLDENATLAALGRLRPPGRDLVVRLNRMFWSDGDEGLARFAALTDRYAAAGYKVALQVRYHPPDGPRRRHRGLDGLRPPRGRHVRAAGRGRRAVDHQRGQPARLGEHVRRLLPGRPRRGGAGHPRRARRGRPARATRPRARLHLRLPLHAAGRQRVLQRPRREGHARVPRGRRPRRPPGLPRAVLPARDDRRARRRARARPRCCARA